MAIDPERMRRAEMFVKDIGRQIDNAMNFVPGPKRFGFCLCIFSFEGEEFAYTSNAERASVIKALEELIAKLRAGEQHGFSADRS